MRLAPLERHWNWHWVTARRCRRAVTHSGPYRQSDVLIVQRQIPAQVLHRARPVRARRRRGLFRPGSGRIPSPPLELGDRGRRARPDPVLRGHRRPRARRRCGPRDFPAVRESAAARSRDWVRFMLANIAFVVAFLSSRRGAGVAGRPRGVRTRWRRTRAARRLELPRVSPRPVRRAAARRSRAGGRSVTYDPEARSAGCHT